MSDPRLTHQLGHHPGAYFRCVVCQRFVTATERGVCPRCGFVAPTLTPTSDRVDPLAWRRARHRLATHRGRARPGWLWLPLIALAAGVAAALAWL